MYISSHWQSQIVLSAIPEYFENEYLGAITTISKRVYFKPYNSDEIDLLFDSNAQIGDTITTWFCPIIINSIDSVLVGDSYHKRYQFDDGNWFIEGVGHRQGLIEHMCISLDYGSQFFCYAENGEPLYIYADMECDLDVGIEKNHSSFLEFNISPNPSTGVIDINLNSQNDDLFKCEIFNISGKLCLKETYEKKDVIQLDCRKLPDGLYLIKVSTNKGELGIKKLIISH